WQDFFEPVFKRIYRWVLHAAMDIGLPKDTSQEVTMIWPQLVAKDQLKETQRGQILNTSGILSKTTWAKDEGLDYADEAENMSLETEMEVSHAQNMDAMAKPSHPGMAAYLKNVRDAQQPAEDVGYVVGGGKNQMEALELITTLNELQEEIDST